MPFPALVPITYDNGNVSDQVAEATGVLDNGNNVIALPWVGQGVDPSLIDLKRIEFRVEALGPSIQAVSEGALSPDKLSVTLVAVQVGTDQAIVKATLNHTIVS
jgi:hypothetical protein